MATKTNSQDPDRRPRGWRLREPRPLALGNLLRQQYEDELIADPDVEPAAQVVAAIADTLARELEWFLSETRRGRP